MRWFSSFHWLAFGMLAPGMPVHLLFVCGCADGLSACLLSICFHSESALVVCRRVGRWTFFRCPRPSTATDTAFRSILVHPPVHLCPPVEFPNFFVHVCDNVPKILSTKMDNVCWFPNFFLIWCLMKLFYYFFDVTGTFASHPIAALKSSCFLTHCRHSHVYKPTKSEKWQVTSCFTWRNCPHEKPHFRKAKMNHMAKWSEAELSKFY